MKKSAPAQWDPAASAADNARSRLPQLTSEFFAAGRCAAAKKAKIKILHGFRLDVKRFRYTLEMFEPLYGPAMGTRLDKLRQLQQRLGALNDCSTARRLILSTGGKKNGLVKQLMARLDKEEKSRKAKFIRYWRDTFDTEGEEDRWVRYLKNYATRTPATSATAKSASAERA